VDRLRRPKLFKLVILSEAEGSYADRTCRGFIFLSKKGVGLMLGEGIDK